ncbi:MAG TPA: hypothetical protein VGJ26_02395 [Pirellulales bacterium]
MTERLESRLALSHAPLAIEDFGAFPVDPRLSMPGVRDQAQFAPVMHSEIAPGWDGGVAPGGMPGQSYVSDPRHDGGIGYSGPANAFVPLREALNSTPVVVVFVVVQEYVPAPTIEVSASPQAVIERASAGPRNEVSAGPAASAHVAAALSVAQRTAEVAVVRAEILPAQNAATLAAGTNPASGPGAGATANMAPHASVTPGDAMLLMPGSTTNIERAGGLSSEEAQAPAVADSQENLQQPAPTQEHTPVVSSTAVADAGMVTAQPNQVIERGPLLATVQVEIESFERALDAALGEIGEMGQDFVGWIEDNINWNSAAAATVAASAAGAYALRRRMRRAAEQEDEELSSTWLFTSFQTPLGHS